MRGDIWRTSSIGTTNGYASSGTRNPGLKPELMTLRFTSLVLLAPPPCRSVHGKIPPVTAGDYARGPGFLGALGKCENQVDCYFRAGWTKLVKDRIVSHVAVKELRLFTRLDLN